MMYLTWVCPRGGYSEQFEECFLLEMFVAMTEMFVAMHMTQIPRKLNRCFYKKWFVAMTPKLQIPK
jgi:hypothetical protein